MEFKIESGIEIPLQKKKLNIFFETIKKMNIGDSVFFEKKNMSSSFYQKCIRITRNNNLSIDWEFTQREVVGGFRVWRTK